MCVCVCNGGAGLEWSLCMPGELAGALAVFVFTALSVMMRVCKGKAKIYTQSSQWKS